MSETGTAVQAVIVYESMFGSTRRIAETIAEGLRNRAATRVIPVREAPETFPGVDVIVVGAPTHAHGLSRPATRAEAGRWGDDPRRRLRLEPDAQGLGVREWLEICGALPRHFAAFDTRADMTELFTGSAAASLDRRLRRAGSTRLVQRASFLVDKESVLIDGEFEHARSWGREIADALVAIAETATGR